MLSNAVTTLRPRNQEITLVASRHPAAADLVPYNPHNYQKATLEPESNLGLFS
jgi:hypothetical protein